MEGRWKNYGFLVNIYIFMVIYTYVYIYIQIVTKVTEPKHGALERKMGIYKT